MNDIVTSSKTIEEISLSKAHKPINSFWKKGLPSMPSYKTTQWAYFNEC